MIAELRSAFDDLAGRDEVRVVVLASEGKSFSAGADLGWMQHMAEYDYDDNHRDAQALAGMLQALAALPQPTIARVQGAAYGGAVGLVSCCDMAVAAEGARFALSEVGRRLRERNLFFFHPADSFQGVLRETLEARRGGEMGAEVVVVAEPPSPVLGDSDVAWVPPGRMPGCPPFLLHFGDGPAYALVCGHKSEQDGVRLFHTSERALVEYLAFRLQKELNAPRLA